MKIEISPSKEFVQVDGIVARVWRGKTGRGTKCIVVVTRIGIDVDASEDEFGELIDLQRTALTVATFEEISLEEPN